MKVGAVYSAKSAAAAIQNVGTGRTFQAPPPPAMKSEGPSELDRHRSIMASQAKQAPAKAAKKRIQLDGTEGKARMSGQGEREISLMRRIVEAKPSPLEQYQAQMLNQAANRSIQSEFTQNLQKAVASKKK